MPVSLHFPLTVYLIADTWLVRRLVSVTCAVIQHYCRQSDERCACVFVCVCNTHLYLRLSSSGCMNQIYSYHKQVLSLSHRNKYVDTHTHNLLPGWHTAGLLAEGMRQWQRCLCGGEFNPGETMEPTGLSWPPPAPPPLWSRRERQSRNVAQACRKMAICSQRFVARCLFARLEDYE